MKKLIVWAVLALALLVTAIACNGETTPADTTADTLASTDATTTVDTAVDTTVDTTLDTTLDTTATTENAETNAAVADGTTAETVLETVAETEPVTEPVTEPDNSYVVDLSTVQFTSSAYAGQYFPGTDPLCAGLHANAGDPTPALGADDTMIIMHYGTVTLGEMDLSKYSKVTITYATPAGVMDVGGTLHDYEAQYNATNKRAMLITEIPAIGPEGVFEGMPTDDSIIASAVYEKSPETGLLMSVEIDLSEVNYSGQTYFTFDFRNPVDQSFGATSYLLYLTGIVFE